MSKKTIVYIEFSPKGPAVPIECDSIHLMLKDEQPNGFYKITNPVGVTEQSFPHIKIEELIIQAKHISYIANGSVIEDEDELDHSEDEDDFYDSSEDLTTTKNRWSNYKGTSKSKRTKK